MHFRAYLFECSHPVSYTHLWDNAYTVHHLYDNPAEQDQLLDIAAACVEAGNPNRYFKFASTSKVTFPGAGLAAMAASAENIAEIKKRMGVQTIGHDKLNQLRHVRFLKDAEGIAAHMAKQMCIRDRCGRDGGSARIRTLEG